MSDISEWRCVKCKWVCYGYDNETAMQMLKDHYIAHHPVLPAIPGEVRMNYTERDKAMLHGMMIDPES